MKRTVVYISLLAFIVAGVFCVPVSASETVGGYTLIDPNDYIEDVFVDGTSETVTLSFSGDGFPMKMQARCVSSGCPEAYTYYDFYMGQDLTHSFCGGTHSIDIFPFTGYTHVGYAPAGTLLNLENLPDGVEIGIELVSNFPAGAAAWTGYKAYFADSYFTKDKKVSHNVDAEPTIRSTEATDGYWTYTISRTIDKSYGDYWACDYSFGGIVGSKLPEVTFRVSSFKIVYTYDMLTDLVETQGEMNATLKLILAEAIETNQNLGDVLGLLQQILDKMGSSGSCDHTEMVQLLQQILAKQEQNQQQMIPTPEQSDKAEQLEGAIGEAADKLENNNSNLGQLTPSRPQISTDLKLDAPSLNAVSPLITNIWSISGVTRMVGIVLVVATVAYIFFGKRDG